MASGHVNRAERPNIRAHRPMLLTWRKSLLTRSRPHTGIKADGTLDLTALQNTGSRRADASVGLKSLAV